MLIGLMSLPNQVVYVQFHPVAYMVKLNIEMSMASLITRLAKSQDSGFSFNSLTYSQRHRTRRNDNHGSQSPGIGPKSFHKASVQAMPSDREFHAMQDSPPGIHQRFDVDIRVDPPRSISLDGGKDDDGPCLNNCYKAGDEIFLMENIGHSNQQR